MTDDSVPDGLDDLEVATLTGGRKLRVHKPEVCAGAVCCIHKPTGHHMIGWPQVWRSDTGMMERNCPHQIGHPDPDHMAHVLTKPGPVGERASGVHGCDGCCRPIEPRPYPEHLWPGCPCKACVSPRTDDLSFQALVHLCATCGNKRCPGAADHNKQCTGSNEIGQPGSLYEDARPFKPNWAIHPGETLGEWIEFIGTTAAAVAQATGLPLERIEAVVAGKAAIDPGMAQKLADHTGIHAPLWINLQALYDTRIEALAAAWKPGDPVYPAEARESSCEACGTTWFPPDDTLACPECGARGAGS